MFVDLHHSSDEVNCRARKWLHLLSLFLPSSLGRALVVECSDLSEAGGDRVGFHLTGSVDFPLAVCDLKADYASISDCQWVFCQKAKSLAHCYTD